MNSKRKRVQWSSSLPSMTQQHMKDECDINSILDKYAKTGFLAHTRTNPGQYGDFTPFTDFRASLDKVILAQSQFDELPAHLRKRFGNDPAELVEFLSDSKNYDEAQKLGFLIPKAETQAAPNDDLTTITQAPSNQPT